MHLTSKLRDLQGVISSEHKTIVEEVINELTRLYSAVEQLPKAIRQAKDAQRKETALQMAEYDKAQMLPMMTNLVKETQRQERNAIIMRIIDTGVLDRFDSEQVIKLINKETIALPSELPPPRLN